jgi:hypothetical protein
MNEIVKNQGMTARELAAQFGCTVRTVLSHAKRIFPGKMRNGVKTYFDERETTLILDSVKSVRSQNETLKVDLQGNVKSPNKTATVNVHNLEGRERNYD